MSDELWDRLQSTLGDQYTLEREMGGGGMSRVFVAEEKALGRKVVVKVLPPDLAAGVSVERFKREIVMAARLQHPHIVPVLAAGEVNGLPYYTMPLVRGESLRTRIARQGELPINETVRILHDVAAALAFAHSDGVVHRDIKPDNVMLTGGVAVVTDLGVGKAVDLAATDPHGMRRDTNLTSMGVALGTPAYMSPEQAAADPGVDHRSDIYALGCMAYEMLTGATPFAARSAPQMLAAHLAETPDPVEKRRHSTPPALAQLVNRCLAKRPADRPQSADEMMAVLDSITSTGSTVAAVPAAKVDSRALPRALTWYFVSAVVVVALAYGATEIIGLPSWVPPGAIIVMALGLPAILFTGWVHRNAARAAAHPTHTPGGTAARLTAVHSIAARVRPHVTWRRTTLGGAAAIATFVLLVVAYMASRAMGIGPAATLAAAGKVDRNQKVLVADFTARGTDSTLAILAAEAVRTDLGQSNALIPVPESEIAAILRLMGQADTARVNLPLAQSIAQREGLRAIVTGEITPLPGNGGLVVAVRLLSVESGDELAAYRETIGSSAELVPALGRLSKTLRAKAGESLKSVRTSPPLERVTTPSLEALREYVAGSRANVNRQFTRAIEHFRKAVALDTLFASAWRSLGINLSNAGMPRAQVDSALEKAYSLRDRLSQVERFRVVTAYFQSGPGRSREQAAQVFEEWLRKDTTSFMGSGGVNNYAIILNGRRQFKRAEEILLLARAAESDLGIHQDKLVTAQFNQGRIGEAEASVAYAMRNFPELQVATAWETAFLYHRGQLDSLERKLENMRRERTGNARSAAIAISSQIAMLRGQLGKSEKLLQEARSVAAERGLITPPGVPGANRAHLEIWFRERPARGVAILDSVLQVNPIAQMPPGMRNYLYVAPLYALAGRPDRARELLREREREVTDTATLRLSEPGVQRAMAEIELAEGRPLEAIRLWRKSDTLPDGPNGSCTICLYADLGRGFLKADQPDSALFWYEKFVNTPFMTRYDATVDPLSLAAAYKTLGELYEGKGDRVKARDYYGRFVKLWEKADPDLQPVVESVRARIARLSGEGG